MYCKIIIWFISIILCGPVIVAQEIQWADHVDFQHNNYGTQNWSGKQALGKPDALPYGTTSPKAFRLNSHATFGTLIVSFDRPQKVRQVIILESFGPGRITDIYLYDEKGKKFQVFKTNAKTLKRDYQTFCLRLQRTHYNVKKVELSINTSLQKGWSQIDAMGIADYDNQQLLREDLSKMGLTNYVEENSFTSEKEDLGFHINSSYSEIKPIISPDGKTLYFCRKNYPGNMNGKFDDQDIYYARWEYDEWSLAKNIGPPLNNQHPNGVSAVSADGNKVLLINRYQRGESGMDLNGVSIATRTRTGWSFPKQVHIKGYHNESKYADFYLSGNGKVLLMAIEQSDSYGDQDIYVSFLEDMNIWSQPMNIGSMINTGKAEFSPFLAADDKTLYFASEGHGGYGGSDIYYTQRTDDTWKNWTKPQNLGNQVNSKGWDAYYSIPASGDYAYFVHGKGTSKNPMNIYRIALPQELRPEPVILVKGKVYDVKNSKPVEATFYLEKDNLVEKTPIANTNPHNGEYSLIMPFDSNHSFKVKAEGFQTQFVKVDIAADNIYQEIEKDIFMERVVYKPVVKLNTIYFEEGKSVILPQSNDDLQEVVDLMVESPDYLIEISGHTDNRGSLHLKHQLSQARAAMIKDTLINAGIDPKRITTAAFGGTQPVASNEFESSRKFNRRVEVKIIR